MRRSKRRLYKKKNSFWLKLCENKQNKNSWINGFSSFLDSETWLSGPKSCATYSFVAFLRSKYRLFYWFIRKSYDDDDEWCVERVTLIRLYKTRVLDARRRFPSDHVQNRWQTCVECESKNRFRGFNVANVFCAKYARAAYIYGIFDY